MVESGFASVVFIVMFSVFSCPLPNRVLCAPSSVQLFISNRCFCAKTNLEFDKTERSLSSENFERNERLRLRDKRKVFRDDLRIFKAERYFEKKSQEWMSVSEECE